MGARRRRRPGEATRTASTRTAVGLYRETRSRCDLADAVEWVNAIIKNHCHCDMIPSWAGFAMALTQRRVALRNGDWLNV